MCVTHPWLLLITSLVHYISQHSIVFSANDSRLLLSQLSQSQHGSLTPLRPLHKIPTKLRKCDTFPPANAQNVHEEYMYNVLPLNLVKSLSREIVVMIVSLWNVTGISAALLSRCMPNFRAIGKSVNSNLAVSRLHHDDVIKWKHFPRYWPFVRGIHRSRWIPRTKASDTELWCFLSSTPE